MKMAGMDVIYTLSPAPKGKMERSCHWRKARIVRTFATEKLIAIYDVRTVLKAELARYRRGELSALDA